MGSARTIAEQFAGVLRHHPHTPFLLAGATWLTVEETTRAAQAAVAVLRIHGATRGDRVVVAMRNSPTFRMLEQGILTSGLVRVALTPRLHAREIAAIAVDCEAKIVCCDRDRGDELAASLRDARSPAIVLTFDETDGRLLYSERSEEPPWPAPGPDDTAILHYSSGTTGAPKGARVSHGAWAAQTRLALAQLAPINAGDVVLAVAPMPHFGGSMALNAAAAGAATVTLGAFAPRQTLAAIIEHEVTVLPLAPIMLARLVEEGGDLLDGAIAHLRAVPYGGSPIDPRRLLHAARQFTGVLSQYYGLSETLAPVTALTAADHDEAVRADESGDAASALSLLSSAGRVVPHTGVRLRADGIDVTLTADASAPGEVEVRSRLVTQGYWQRPDLTSAAIDGDGWFRTADLGWLDRRGLLHLTDRKTDMIVSGGFNVQPREVEDVIRLLPFVREVAVVGVPDERWGQRVHAAISLTHELEAAEVAQGIEAACRERLAAYKRPLSLEIVDDLPRTPLDKIDRKAIRRRIGAL